MFQGRFEHSLDDKSRLAIPAPFRKQLGDNGTDNVSVVITVADQCIQAFTQREWEQKVVQINRQNQLMPNVVAFKRLFIGCSQECPIDKAGRILIPADLRSYAGIEKSCIVLGQVDKFEIWSEDRWQQCFNQMSDQMGAICASLAEQGIHL